MYKWHALGDFVRAIRLFGLTDGFSTQVVSNLFLMQLSYSCFLVKRVNSPSYLFDRVLLVYPFSISHIFS
jgi:hypothetical protein